MKNHIFDLSVAKEEGKFVEKGLFLESDVASEVIDTMVDFPWISLANDKEFFLNFQMF